MSDQEYDLWAYRNIQHRFVRWLGRETGTLSAVLGVENGWFVGDKKVMTERIWLTVHHAGDDQRAIDVRLVLLPTDKPVTLWGAAGKSYGGLNIRYSPSVAELQARQASPPAATTVKKSDANPKVDPAKPAAAKPKADAAKTADAKPKKPVVKAPPRAKDTFITVPDGLADADLPDTRLPWADLVRNFPGAGQPSGAAIFVDRSMQGFIMPGLKRNINCHFRRFLLKMFESIRYQG